MNILPINIDEFSKGQQDLSWILYKDTILQDGKLQLEDDLIGVMFYKVKLFLADSTSQQTTYIWKVIGQSTRIIHQNSRLWL